METKDRNKGVYSGRKGIVRRYFETTSIKGVAKVRNFFWALSAQTSAQATLTYKQQHINSFGL